MYIHTRKEEEVCWVGKDTRPGMLSHFCDSAMCVQSFNDSLSRAIHITYRSSQRSSSLYEPRDPPLKVVGFVFAAHAHTHKECVSARFARLLISLVMFVFQL